MVYMDVITIWWKSLESNVYAMLLYSLAGALVFRLFPRRLRTIVLATESLLFYAICDFRFLGLLLIETGFTWLMGGHIGKIRLNNDHENSKKNKSWLTVGIACIVLILAFFKYENFFVEIFGLSITRQMMPLGISYYSFRQISYLVDVYQGKIKWEPSFIRYASYVLFFPHIVCGPIVRARNMLDTSDNVAQFTYSGGLLILSGLFKKVVIADRISPYVTTVFDNYQSVPGIALWLALILNAIYIYCDFAGYSEIFVGVTRLYGFSCDLNFNLPYFSKNMKEFWRRWHISLSSWLRDYIYIPLGGNRKGTLRKACNVMVVFLVCGVWHGNTMMYFLWGIYHGILNLIDGSVVKITNRSHRYWNIIGAWKVFILNMLGWLIFRGRSISWVGAYLIRMIRDFRLTYADIVSSILIFTQDNTCVSYFLTAIAEIFILFMMELHDRLKIGRYNESSLRYGVLTVLILLFGMAGSGSFLYANF